MVLGSQTNHNDEDIAFLRGMVPEGSRAQTRYEDYLNEVLEETQPKSKTLRGQRFFLIPFKIFKAGIDFVGSLLSGIQITLVV